MKLFAIAALAYFFCLQFVFPGYFHPLYPHHDDFYFPPGLSFDGHSLLDKLQWPRPLGFLVTELLGKLGLKGYLFALVLVTLANATLTMSLARRIFGQPISWFIGLAYCILLFAHPDFYVDYLHDAFGTLAYLYLILAMHAWYSYRETNGGHWPVICAILVLAIAFTKETYFLSALCFWMVQIYLCRGAQRRTGVLMLAGSCAFFVAGLAANAYSMKTVLHLQTGATSPYRVSLEPAAVVRGFWFYASRLFHPAVLVLVCGGVAVLYRRREQMIMAWALLLAGICALLPYTVLPNHVDSMYAWTGATLLFRRSCSFRGHSTGRPPGEPLRPMRGVAALAFLSIRTSTAQYEEHRWTIAQEKANRNIIDSYPALKGLDASVRKVLITGLDMPFQPFHTASYIRSEFAAGERMDRADTGEHRCRQIRTAGAGTARQAPCALPITMRYSGTVKTAACSTNGRAPNYSRHPRVSRRTGSCCPRSTRSSMHWPKIRPIGRRCFGAASCISNGESWMRRRIIWKDQLN